MRRAVALLALVAVASLAAQETAPRTRLASAAAREFVAKFAAASAAADAAAMESLARDCAIDPFELAHAFVVVDLELGEDRLAAAHRHAELAAGAKPSSRELPALVDRWIGWDEGERAAERELQQALESARLSLARGQPDETLAAWDQARELAAEVPASASALLLEREAAFALLRKERFGELAQLGASLSERARSLGWTRMRALGDVAVGEASRGASDWEPGLAAFERALEIGADCLRPRELANANLGLAVCLQGLERAAESRRHYELAAGMFAAVREPVPELAAREQVVLLAQGEGRHFEAMEAAQRWLAAARAAGVARDEAYALWQLGLEAGRVDRFDVAVDALEQAVVKLRALGKEAHAGGVLLVLAEIRCRQRKPEHQRALIEQARAILAKHPNEALARDLRDEEASWEEYFGDPRKAIALYEETLAIAERRKEMKAVASVLGDIAELRMRLDDWEGAKLAAERSFTGYRELGDAYGTSKALQWLGCIAARMEDAERGHELLQAALAIAHELRDPERISFIQYDVARVQLALGRHAQSASTARQAAERDLEFAESLSEWDALGPVGWARRVADLGILASARWLESGEEPAAAMESLWWLVEATRAPLLARRLAQLDDAGGLVLTAEAGELRERAQSLRRELAGEAAAAAPAAISALQERTTELRRGVALSSMDPASTPDAIAALARDYGAACLELESQLARLEREQRGESPRTPLRPLPLAEVQAALPPEAVLLVYTFASPGRSEALVLAIDAARCESIRLPLAPERIRELLEGWATLVDASGGGGAGEQAAEEAAAARAYDALLRPVLVRLAGKQRVVVVPDAWLATFPFEPFLRVEPGGSRRAVEEHEFVLAPSASALVRMLRRPAKDARDARRLLAAGDPEYRAHPRLPASRSEVAAIAALYPDGDAVTLLGAEATRARLRQELQAAPAGDFVLHLACHGAVDATHPLLHGVVLSGDELFALSDLVDLRARASLAVLSCCETGLARLELGENQVGWAHELLESGVARVVVADWRLDDERTAAFMARFHAVVRSERKTPSAALRAVKLEWLRAGGRDAAPRAWAPFVLWGRWD